MSSQNAVSWLVQPHLCHKKTRQTRPAIITNNLVINLSTYFKSQQSWKVTRVIAACSMLQCCSAAVPVLRAAADRVLPGNGGELSGNTTKGVSKISQNTLHWRNFTVHICDFSFFAINENLCVQATQFQLETVFECVQCLIIFLKLWKLLRSFVDTFKPDPPQLWGWAWASRVREAGREWGNYFVMFPVNNVFRVPSVCLVPTQCPARCSVMSMITSPPLLWRCHELPQPLNYRAAGPRPPSTLHHTIYIIYTRYLQHLPWISTTSTLDIYNIYTLVKTRQARLYGSIH